MILAQNMRYGLFGIKDGLGKKNGELLRCMVQDSFELFITIDRNLPYQQNLTKLPVSIFVLCAKDSRRDTLRKLIPKIFETINEGHLNKVVELF